MNTEHPPVRHVTICAICNKLIYDDEDCVLLRIEPIGDSPRVLPATGTRVHMLRGVTYVLDIQDGRLVLRPEH